MCKSWGTGYIIISYEPDRTGDFPFEDEILTTLCLNFRKKRRSLRNQQSLIQKEKSFMISSEIFNIVVIYHT
jgi:hypothetical protein